MIQRCSNPKNTHYKYYGERGITVCDEWAHFENFLRDMGEAPAGSLLDRENNNLGYFNGNCRWTDSKTSSRNRRNLVMITFGGETKCAAEWAEELGINASTIRDGVKRGVSIEQLFNLT